MCTLIVTVNNLRITNKINGKKSYLYFNNNRLAQDKRTSSDL